MRHLDILVFERMKMDDLLEYEGLVYGIINRYSSYFDLDDLYQVGMLGLIDAYKHYNCNLNTKFSTYAYYYILGEVKKYVRESNLVKVGGELVKVNQAVERAKEKMSQTLGREPTLIELSTFLEIDAEKIEEARIAALDIRSLDYTSEDESNDLYNSIISTDNGMKCEILDLKMALEGLNSDEKNLIISRYFNDLTQSETSKELGITQVQVSRKEGKILEKLKSVL